MNVVLSKNKKGKQKMPMYDYICEKHGRFESFESLSNRRRSQCPICNCECGLADIQGVNRYMAKTKYIFPPMAQKKFGEKRRIPHRKAKWY